MKKLLKLLQSFLIAGDFCAECPGSIVASGKRGPQDRRKETCAREPGCKLPGELIEPNTLMLPLLKSNPFLQIAHSSHRLNDRGKRRTPIVEK